MKYYKSYMDQIEVPEHLHERLTRIPSEKHSTGRSQLRQWYPLAVAACLCLVTAVTVLPSRDAEEEPLSEDQPVAIMSLMPPELTFCPAEELFQLPADALPSEVLGVEVYAGYVEQDALWFAIFTVNGEEYQLSDTSQDTLALRVEETISQARSEEK